MSSTLDLSLATPWSGEAVSAALAADPAVTLESGGSRRSAPGLDLIEVVDVRGSPREDAPSGLDGFRRTVLVWAQLDPDAATPDSFDHPGLAAFAGVAARLLARVPGDALLTSPVGTRILWRRRGELVLLGGWWPERLRAGFGPHAAGDIPQD